MSTHPAYGRRVTMFVLNDMRLDSRVRREAAALARAGHAVTVFAVMSEATRHLAREAVDGYSIVREPMLMRPATEPPRGRGEPVRPPELGRRLLASAFVSTRPVFGGTVHFLANWTLRWRAWGRRVMEHVHPSEVWHAHDLNTLPIAIECAERFGGAVVYDSHELFTEAGATSRLPPVVRALLRRRERSWAARASAVITVNQSLAAVLREQLSVAEVTVVHNCAELPQPGRTPLRTAIGVGPDTDIVLYHGSVTTGRGLEALVASFEDERLSAAHLVIMGYGPLRPEIERLASASRARAMIHLLPPVPPADLTAWVSDADVAVMPIQPTTVNHRLSSPNKLFEAIAAGVPVVGPDFVEFRRIVLGFEGGPLGRLHREHTPRAIADAIHAILSLPTEERAALRARCAAAARARWNWGIEVERLLATYNRLRMAEPAEAISARARTTGGPAVAPQSD